MPCYPYNRGGNYGDYYRGDYYRGDYYQGDPGIFSGVGKLLGGVAKLAGKIVPGPAGFALGALGGLATRRPGMALALQAPIPVTPVPGVRGALQRFLPFGATGFEVAPGAGLGCQIKGTRPNKSTYITRGGGTSRWPQELVVHAKGTECVKIRRMNVANPRALRRGLRRAAGFVKLARRAHVKLQQFTGRAKRFGKKR